MKHEDNIERLSTIYESPSPQLEIEDIFDDTYDKLIVYDIANIEKVLKQWSFTAKEYKYQIFSFVF